MSNLTRQHFRLIAEAMTRAKPMRSISGSAGRQLLQWKFQCQQLAVTLKQINPLFKTRIFLEACGMDPDEAQAVDAIYSIVDSTASLACMNAQ